MYPSNLMRGLLFGLAADVSQAPPLNVSTFSPLRDCAQPEPAARSRP
jgi:hypothetical protein